MNEIRNSFSKRSYGRWAFQLTKIFSEVLHNFLTGFSVFQKENCWVRAWISAFLPPSFILTISELSLNVFALNSSDVSSHKIYWFWSKNLCLHGRYVPTLCDEHRRLACANRKTKAMRCTHCIKTAISSEVTPARAIMCWFSTPLTTLSRCTLSCVKRINSSPARTITISLTFINFRIAWGASSEKAINEDTYLSEYCTHSNNVRPSYNHRYFICRLLQLRLCQVAVRLAVGVPPTWDLCQRHTNDSVLASE